MVEGWIDHHCHTHHYVYRWNGVHIQNMLALFVRQFPNGILHRVTHCNCTYQFILFIYIIFFVCACVSLVILLLSLILDHHHSLLFVIRPCFGIAVCYIEISYVCTVRAVKCHFKLHITVTVIIWVIFSSDIALLLVPLDAVVEKFRCWFLQCAGYCLHISIIWDVYIYK